jgi:hypothetical protein
LIPVQYDLLVIAARETVGGVSAIGIPNTESDLPITHRYFTASAYLRDTSM